ncbi:MAG: THUMP domain-containing protein [Candidatus Thermoplasmatota archaeon]
MNYDVIILRYGELSLKSTYVRKYFETILVRNIKKAFLTENVPVDIQTEWGRIYLTTTDLSKSASILPRIFGMVSFSPAMQTSSSLQEMSAIANQITKSILHPSKSFAIRVTRVGTHPFSSQDVARHIGNDIVNATHARVDLNTPDLELFIEIREKNSFLFTEKIKGVGGLPLGTQGRILILVTQPSSLLAAWYLMRRGCNCVLVTVNGIDEERIRSFLASWYADAEIIRMSHKDNEFYRLLSEIVTEKKCDAIATDHTLDKIPDALADIVHLKETCVVPILSPLISMDQKELANHCKNRGIPL